MKTLRILKKSIAIFLLIVFSSYFFTGCYTLESSTRLSTERIPGTEKKTGKKKYTYGITQEPAVNNPEVKLKIQKAKEYKVRTKTKYRYVYLKNITRSNEEGGWSLGIGISAIVASVIVGIAVPNYEGPTSWGYCYDCWPTGKTIAVATLIPSGVVLTGLGIGILAAAPSKKRYKHKRSDEYFYKNKPLSNFNISITSSNLATGMQSKSTVFQTNNNGLLKFNLVNDFNIINSIDNNPITFSLKTKNVAFDKSLKLKPSLWMNKYAKITRPECTIWKSKNYYSDKLGIARKGMEYIILAEQDKQYKIELVNKTGWIKTFCAETFYSIPKKKDISIVIKKYVEEKMNFWQKQDEFEASERYMERMYTRKNKLNDITQQAMNMFQQDYIELIEWDKSTISRYDPNRQTFKIDIPDLQEIIVTVPIGIAQNFKEHWERVSFKNQKFILFDSDWKLVALDLKNTAMNYTVRYNSKVSNTYDPTNQFGFKLDPIDIAIPTQNNETGNIDDIFDPYSININLPQTNMSNPDAIAVVIGNSNYKYINPVNFAINDAQLIKTYLTNVLGFKPGNIIFRTDATKGEFEGLFGKKGDHKGKLFNYVKPGISDVFVFYSGHGAPGIKDTMPYFVPSRCEWEYVELQGYPLKVFYENLAKIPARSTTVVLDACFSGAGIIKDISAQPKIKPKDILIQIKNSAIITSSTGKEVSSWYNEKQHGLFTWFFLKAIHDHKNSDKNNIGKLTFQEIFDYISDYNGGVPYYARRIGIEQHPTIQGNAKDRVFVEY